MSPTSNSAVLADADTDLTLDLAVEPFDGRLATDAFHDEDLELDLRVADGYGITLGCACGSATTGITMCTSGVE